MYPPADVIPLSRPIILKAPNEVQGAEFGRVTRAYWLVPFKTYARDTNPRLVIVVAKIKRAKRPAIMVNRIVMDLIWSPRRVRLAHLTRPTGARLISYSRDFAGGGPRLKVRGELCAAMYSCNH